MSAEEKCMRSMVRMLIGLCLVSPVVSEAASVWSSCQTITAVTNESVNGTLLLTLSPGISGCSALGVTGAVQVQVGQDSVVADNLTSLLATSLSAFSLGKNVLVAYDNGSSNCYTTAISIGGYSNQCP